MDKLATPQLKQILLYKQHALPIQEQILFKASLEGLRVWESDINLARFFLRNAKSIANLNILEVGCGTGLTSLLLSKLAAPPSKLVLTDYQEQVLDLARKNIALACKLEDAQGSQIPVSLAETQFLQSLKLPLKEPSGKKREIRVQKLDWKSEQDLSKLDQPFDLIFGSDLVYQGSPYTDLARVVDSLQAKNTGLSFILAMPEERGCAAQFIATMEGLKFSCRSIKLEDADFYRKAALEDEKESDFQYPGLTRLTFRLFGFRREQ